MTDDSLKNEFVRLCESTGREGMMSLLAWLDTTDFYTAPASRQNHGAYPGGLLAHSMNVYTEALKLYDLYSKYSEEIAAVPRESLIIAALLHDLCKVNFYEIEWRNRKGDDGRWESYPAYKISERFRYGGHGCKSVWLIERFMKLTPEEAVAINSHMGAFDDNYVGETYRQFPFAWLIHVADESAAYIAEPDKEARWNHSI